MFSYLHGIRPNNRRSAVIQAAAPPQNINSRYYHEGSPTSQGAPNFNLDPPHPRTSQPNSLNESPVSPNPPVLPPIPRIASQRESERAEIRDVWNHKEDTAPSELFQEQSHQQVSSIPQFPVPNNSSSTSVAPKDWSKRKSGGSSIGTLPTYLNQGQHQGSTSRPRRPIDVAYESMRSYTEPLNLQSSGYQPESQQLIPQPLRRPPPPPPKPSHRELEPQRQTLPPPGKPPQQAQPTASQYRHGKTRLNLLNPMSLLARRRPSRAVQEAYSQNQTASGMRLPDDYDPRIRGKVVHDFSAPRTGRNNSFSESTTAAVQTKEKEGLSEISQRRISLNPSSSFLEDESPSSTEKEHTPVFKENFDENLEPWHDGLDSPAKRRTSAFVYKMSIQEAQPEPDPSSLPAFARALPPKVPPKAMQTVSSGIDATRKTSSSPRPPLEKVLESPLPNHKSVQAFPPISPPKTRSRSRSTSLSDQNFDGPGSPRRYKSNASRFSFDLAGVGSAAQEQLLEEKHRQQKAKRKQHESVISDGTEVDDEDGYAEYDGMDDDDGLEEKVPGVNADDGDFELPFMQQPTETSFISPNKSSFDSALSPVSTGLTSPATPRENQGQPSGFAVSKPSTNTASPHLEVSQSLSKQSNSRPKSVPGVASDPGFNVQSLPREFSSEGNLASLPSRYEYQDEDDMYFDDGMIEDIDDEENQGFDESVFDDDTSRVYGLPLRDLKPLLLPQNIDSTVMDQVSGPKTHVARQSSSKYDTRNLPVPESPEDDATAAELMDKVADLKQPTRGSLSQAAGLTQDNLGLHDQLAMAANQAQLAGRFQRSYSLASTHESNNNLDTSAQMQSYNKPMTLPVNSITGPRIGEDVEDFPLDDAQIDFDDEEADDTIIAAANAEALENDDDGFYGQEFGFFARASGSSESEFVHGGYFGPRALEGIHRMNSGRENKDPSLTPITERSEWSNRNSAISLAMHGYPLSAQYPSNPQLASLMNVPEDEMTLEALRKLRRGAWSGSNGSLQSSSNSPSSGSPLTYLPPGMMIPSLLQPANSNGQIVNTSNQNLAGSFHSYSSSNGHASSVGSDPSPLLESPTITLSTSQPGLYVQQPIGPPPPPPAENTSPVRRNAINGKSPWAPSHSRNSSGAESVSYREEGGKWVCEKRRVDATGEIEVLGRSVVEGGRI